MIPWVAGWESGTVRLSCRSYKAVEQGGGNVENTLGPSARILHRAISLWIIGSSPMMTCWGYEGWGMGKEHREPKVRGKGDRPPRLTARDRAGGFAGRQNLP